MSAPRIELDSAEAIDGRHIRALAFHDVRMRYLSEVLAKVGVDGGPALVVGSGRGLIATGLAERGFAVTGVDPSPSATALARTADPASAATYVTAPAEDPGLPDGAFTLIYYADTFEITSRLDQVLAHAARLLAPGGVLVYDTVNRTLPSRLVYLGAFQGIPTTRIMPPGRYSASRLRPPAELSAAMERNGLRNRDVCGFKPSDPRNLLKAVLARRKGRITDAEIPPLVDFVLDPKGSPVVTYLGYATRV
ncbi:class I SAM-dependent methyltransferase [Phytomonospora sp. NPDC050363]|uniref:class I SAM-dependent methyltransferase n=1 Tax=Phytomonospora sp. NPDC050363 TaxID=3155642 RepID=UPI0033CB6A43